MHNEVLLKLLFLTGLVTLLLISSTAAVVQGQPKWAREGVYLVYGWALWEYVPEEKIESTIEILKTIPGIFFNLSLTKFDEKRGYFLLRDLSGEVPAEYYWEEGLLRIDNQTSTFFILYKPLSKLAGLPIVDVKTRMGTMQAYEERIGNISYIIYRFHKDTGILLEVIAIQGPMQYCEQANTSCWDILVMFLVDTNIPRVRPSITIHKDIVSGEEIERVSIETSSNLTDVVFDEAVRELRFTVSGKPGEPGFCNVSLSKRLAGEKPDIEVYFDSQPIQFELSENFTHYFIYFEYVHSAHTVIIRLPPPAPQLTRETAPSGLPTWELLLLITIAVIATVSFYTILKLRAKQKLSKS